MKKRKENKQIEFVPKKTLALNSNRKIKVNHTEQSKSSNKENQGCLLMFFSPFINLLARNAANKEWKRIQSDPELMQHHKRLEETRNNIEKIKKEVDNDPELAKFFKEMGVKLDDD